MTRKEVENQIALLEVEANKKQMSLSLYESEKELVNGVDLGSERLIVMTRMKLKNAPKLAESEFVAELIKLSKGEPSDKVKALGVKDLGAALAEIGEGNVRLSKYEAHIEKTKLFSWDEIVPKVLSTLEEFGLKREFKLKGVTGVVTGNA